MEDDIDNSTQLVRIPCDKCGKNYNIWINKDLVREITNFPFPVLLMHTSAAQDCGIHTLVAYLDAQLKCRSVEFITSNQVFITPFILYNPSLLNVYCLNGNRKRKDKPKSFIVSEEVKKIIPINEVKSYESA